MSGYWILGYLTVVPLSVGLFLGGWMRNGLGPRQDEYDYPYTPHKSDACPTNVDHLSHT